MMDSDEKVSCFRKAPFPGPLMCCRMQKDDLMRYIHRKAQTCLRGGARDRSQAYVFWEIMDLFCCNNGVVMMDQVGAIVHKCYNLLLIKVKDYERLHAWCLPLAQLLCSSASDDECKETLINMGDYLAINGFTYAAHICFMLAKVELGTRSQFELIGCNSTRFPFGTIPMTSAIERTEVYEYVLSLTSGQAQLNFQTLKLCYASRLAQQGHLNKAIEYCETIARTVITFPCRFKMSLYERLISLSDHVCKVRKEPEWLDQLHQLRAKVKILRATTDLELLSLYSDSEMETSNSENDSMGVTYQSSDIQCHNLNPEVDFESRYIMGELLGHGTCGYVYAGIRRTDQKEVVIKIVEKNHYYQSMMTPGMMQEVPVDVVLMQMVSEPPFCNNIEQLLEWFIMTNYIVMVLERHSPYLVLADFITRHGGRLTEEQARVIMLQVIQVARHCCDCEIHRDIKVENMIINTNTMQIKLTDFGFGALLKDTPYTAFTGSPALCPPAYEMLNCYMGVSCTVWSLGVMLFSLVCGNVPFQCPNNFEDVHLELSPDVSRDFIDLLLWCLDLKPDLRPSLEDITNHEWFSEA